MNISPRVVINKKNYIFGEAINQISKDKSVPRKHIHDASLKQNQVKKHIPIRKANSITKMDNLQPKPLQQSRAEAEVPNFNPFEVSTKKQSRKITKTDIKFQARSNSDLINKN